MKDDYDSPWKKAIDAYFEPFMSFFFPELHAEINWRRRHVSLDKELQQITREGELGRRVVDMLLKVWLKNGRQRWFLVHVEVQTSKQADFAKRMFICNARLFDRYNREVVSLAVLADDHPDWRPESFGYGLGRYRAGLSFAVAKLLDYAPRWEALEKDPNPFAMLALAHLKTRETRRRPGARRVWKVRLIKGLYQRKLSRAEVRQLFGLIDWMMTLPPRLGERFWQEIKQYEKEKQMQFMTTPERIGRAEGLTEGLTKGRAEGLTKGLTRGIELALELKFGEAGLALMPEIRQIADEAKLEAVLRGIRTAARPEDLRRLWTS